MRRYLRTASWTPRLLLISFLLFITWYTDLVFFRNPRAPLVFEDILFYSLPSIIVLGIVLAGWKHERFEGVAVMLISFVFLFMYHVYLSLAVFCFLLFTAALLLIDDYKITHYKRRKTGVAY